METTSGDPASTESQGYVLSRDRKRLELWDKLVLALMVAANQLKEHDIPYRVAYDAVLAKAKELE